MNAPFTLDDRYRRTEGVVYLSGIQALVRVVMDRMRWDRASGRATAAFVSGYEGSPLAGLDLELARRSTMLAELDVVHRPGLNEELAATSVMGTQHVGSFGGRRVDGVAGFWYGKSPGLDRASDALRHANLAGTDPAGGAVALVGDDPNAKSSSVPGASERLLADLAMPTFVPADSQDLLDLGRHAVELSRAAGLWSAMKIVTNVADASGTAVLHPGWRPPDLCDLDGLAAYGHRPSSRLLGAELAALERSLYEQRLPLATAYLRASGVNQVVAGGPSGQGRLGVVAAGKAYLDLRQALRSLGLDDEALERHGIRLLRLGAIWPLVPEQVLDFAAGLAEVVVVEEKRGFLEPAVKEVLYGVPDAPVVVGKRDPSGRVLFGEAGELDPDVVAAGLAARLEAHPGCGATDVVSAWRQRRRRERVLLPVLAGTARTPYFCSGCPHNSSTQVPDGTVVGAGIGCHTMTLFMDPQQAGTVVGISQMGGEGAQWIGASPFVDTPHLVQNLGDGTFWHSGSLAVRAAVASGANVTYKLLHNSVVAMTGGQDAVGAKPVEQVAALLLAEGVRKIVVTTDDPATLRRRRFPRGVEVRPRDQLLRTQEELAAVPGVTVLIHDQECAAEKRRKRRRGTQETPRTRVLINERVCEGCGDCGTKSNCLSVHPVDTEFGRKTQIHQSSCNVDYSCLSGDCPSFLTVEPVAGAHRRRGAVADPLDAQDLPEPDRATGDFTVRITGIGGTGVVTVAQVLATAAVVAGRQVRTLDQTGLAQKGGAVVSDVKVTATPVDAAPKIAGGEADLYLACDLLVGVDPAHLRAADPGRTVAVVSTTEVPTGRMVVDTTVAFPDQDAIRSAIDEACARTVYLDAHELAERWFGDAQYANILQLGAAYQTGVVALPAAAIEQAITLNGVDVDRNVQAFRRGRYAVAAPDAGSEAQRSTDAQAGGSGELERLLEVRVPELVAYQDRSYAEEYTAFVEETRVLEGGATDVTEQVARHLYKLMSYKDEYEVARLSVDPALDTRLAEEFGTGARYRYHLHPPLLRALGMKRKLRLGPWFRVVFRVLYAMRFLRGTRLDPFGYADVRRVERRLIGEYRESVRGAMTAGDHALALELASLPDLVRGYEHVKLANVEEYDARRRRLLESPSETVRARRDSNPKPSDP